MQLLTNNFEEIELFGKKVLLSERTARDVEKLRLYSQKTEGSISDSVFQSAVMVRDALQINFKKLKWWQIVKRLWFKKICNEKYLIKHLSERVIFKLSEKVLVLEGVDIEALKKKITLEMEKKDGLAVTLQKD